MKDNHTAIHRAAKNIPSSPLPADFHTKIAARIQEERRRERNIEKITNIACCATAIAMFAVAIVWIAQRLEINWALPTLKNLDWQHIKQWGYISFAISILLILNSYIDTRLQLRRLKKEVSKQQTQ